MPDIYVSHSALLGLNIMGKETSNSLDSNSVH